MPPFAPPPPPLLEPPAPLAPPGPALPASLAPSALGLPEPLVPVLVPLPCVPPGLTVEPAPWPGGRAEPPLLSLAAKLTGASAPRHKARAS
ncbi:hypothetical protein EGJ27_14000 [Pseudomonas sp. v388]|nr:hypothetical protein EGJ27_14000 [Pseudomonas sp. v388]